MVISIIGKIGSGKSACVKYIKENFDVIVFSCDEIAKEMMAKNEINFDVSDSEDFFTNLDKQEECRIRVHNPVFSRINENINIFHEQKPIIIECALPSDMLFQMSDKVICIKNSDDTKRKLLLEHRGYSFEKTNQILKSQEYYDKYYDRADYIIDNNGTKEELLNKLKEVLNEIHIIRK